MERCPRERKLGTKYCDVAMNRIRLLNWSKINDENENKFRKLKELVYPFKKLSNKADLSFVKSGGNEMLTIIDKSINLEASITYIPKEGHALVETNSANPDWSLFYLDAKTDELDGFVYLSRPPWPCRTSTRKKIGPCSIHKPVKSKLIEKFYLVINFMPKEEIPGFIDTIDKLCNSDFSFRQTINAGIEMCDENFKTIFNDPSNKTECIRQLIHYAIFFNLSDEYANGKITTKGISLRSISELIIKTKAGIYGSPFIKIEEGNEGKTDKLLKKMGLKNYE